MSTSIRIFALLASVLALTGCIRTEWRPAGAGDCPPNPQPSVSFNVDSLAVLTGMFVGRVVDRESAQPVVDARVEFEQMGLKREVMSAKDGTFRLDSVSPGPAVLRVMRVGFEMRRDSITVPSRAGLALTVPLRMLPWDGCAGGFAQVRVRKLRWPRW